MKPFLMTEETILGAYCQIVIRPMTMDLFQNKEENESHQIRETKKSLLQQCISEGNCPSEDDISFRSPSMRVY